MVASLLLSGCMNGLWTGANLFYDRHHVYKKIADFRLAARAKNALQQEQRLRPPSCMLDLTVFHNQILLAGHVPSLQAKQWAQTALESVDGYQHLYNQLRISQTPSNAWLDTWITAKIRTKILADDSIDPTAIKIVTMDSIVYLLGEMQVAQAKKVIRIASRTLHVQKVVTLLSYYTYSNKINQENRGSAILKTNT